MTVILRRDKGSALTYDEMDDNFEYLLRYNTANNIWYDNSVSNISANNVQTAIDATISAVTVGIAESTPPGAVLYFARQTAPAGWLHANGAAVSRVTYAKLFEALGTLYGAGDGSTTFNLPDLRGEFLRGWDNGRGADSGRAFGSSQGDAIRNISGTFSGNTDDGATYFSGPFYINSTTATGGNGGTGQGVIGFDASRQVPTAAENRPRNIALLACIKY